MISRKKTMMDDDAINLKTIVDTPAGKTIIDAPPSGKTIINEPAKTIIETRTAAKTIIAFDGKKPIENVMPKNKVNYMPKKISIRNAKTAKPGLIDVIHYWEEKMMRSFSTVVMAEIGSYVGDSTEIWARHCKTVHCIDPWINGYDDTDPSSYVWDMEIIEHQFDALAAQYPNIKKHKMVSTEGAELFKDETLDFIYLDGNHLFEYVKMDIVAWLPKLKKPGLFGGHDYQHKWAPEVKPAVLEMFGGIDKHFQDTSWVRWVAK